MLLKVNICKCIAKKLPCSSIFMSFQRVKITTLIFLALGNGIHHGIKFCTKNKKKNIFNSCIQIIIAYCKFFRVILTEILDCECKLIF